MEQLRNEISGLAREQGIDEIRFIDAEYLEPIHVFTERQPRVLMPSARSLIMSSIYIGAFQLKEDQKQPELHGKMSRLTLSGFYFNVVKPLEPIRDLLIANGYQAMIYDGLLEDNCIPLKAAAVKAGLGWIGKHTLLVHPDYGTWQALGAIITDADLAEVNTVLKDQCGSCTSCLEHCPTQALKPRKLDRSRCLSNLLEEPDMPDSITAIPEQYFFECDLCQEACPWNQKHLSTPLKTPFGSRFTGQDGQLTNQEELLELFRFDALLQMNEKEYNQRILPLLTGVPLSYDLFRRNVLLARGGAM